MLTSCVGHSFASAPTPVNSLVLPTSSHDLVLFGPNELSWPYITALPGISRKVSIAFDFLGCSRDLKLISLVNSRSVFVGLGIGGAQVDLCRRDVGMPEFVAEGFDVHPLMVPSGGVEYTKGMAGLLRLLDCIPSLVHLGKKAEDNPVEMLVYDSLCG